MAARGVADFLMDFGSPISKPTLALAAPPAAPVIAPISVDKQIREAVEAAEAAMAARFADEQQVLRAELEQAHAAEQAKREDALLEQTAMLIEDRLQAANEALVKQTHLAVARVLSAALTKQMQERVLDKLAATLRAALADNNAVRLRVSGPVALYAALIERLGDTAPDFEFTQADAVDLTVTIDEALYATRLGDWSAELAEVLR